MGLGHAHKMNEYAHVTRINAGPCYLWILHLWIRQTLEVSYLEKYIYSEKSIVSSCPYSLLNTIRPVSVYSVHIKE